MPAHELTHEVLPAGRGPLIVKLGGAALDAPDAETSALFAALAALHRALPGGVVLVHGGGAAVDRHLERLGLTSQRHEGIRLTPPEHVEEIVAVLAGRVNKQMVGRLQRQGVPAVGLCLGDGFTARTSRVRANGVDPGCVGEVCGGDPSLVSALLGGGFLPVLCSIGLDEHGQPLNVNADAAAAGLAMILGAARLLLLTDTPGVLDPDGALIGALAAGEVETLVAAGTIAGGMIAKVRSARSVAEAAGTAVTIASWREPAALMGLARGAVAGTSILPAVAAMPEPTSATGSCPS